MNNFNKLSDLDTIYLMILCAASRSPGSTSQQFRQKVELSETALNGRLRNLCSAKFLYRIEGHHRGKGARSYQYFLSNNISKDSISEEIAKRKAERNFVPSLLENFPQEEQSSLETNVLNKEELDLKFEPSNLGDDKFAIRDREASTSNSDLDENDTTKQDISTKQETIRSSASQLEPEENELEQELTESPKQHILKLSRDPSLKKLAKAFSEVIDNLASQKDINVHALDNCISTDGNQLNMKFTLSISSKRNNKKGTL